MKAYNWVALIHLSSCAQSLISVVPAVRDLRTQTRTESALLASKEDTRPHEQRRKSPRPARRLNHSFQHLYRHGVDESSEDLTARVFLETFGGYSDDEITDMSEAFPPLLKLDVERHLKPKLKFLKYTLGGADRSSVLSRRGKSIPAQYYGTRLERTVAPYHAFLVWQSLPHGKRLLRNDSAMMTEFLRSTRNSASFAALCNAWRRQHPHDGAASSLTTPGQVDAFDTLFRRGLLSVVRNDAPPDVLSLSGIRNGGEMVNLLIRHGANPRERDARGVGLLHWACGAGNLEAVRVLCAHDGAGLLERRAERDGASPLHWAAVGVEAKRFGSGGHLGLCRWILNNLAVTDADNNARSLPRAQEEAVNALTKDGNSVLMWASWAASSLDIIQLLLAHGAEPGLRNKNGCSVAHWAASGGNLEVCRYLESVWDVPFVGVTNHAGNSPLSHAVAYGRKEVVEWLMEMTDEEIDLVKAKELATDFVGWSSGAANGNDNKNRKIVMDLF